MGIDYWNLRCLRAQLHARSFSLDAEGAFSDDRLDLFRYYVGKKAVFCAERIPEESREFFLNEIGFKHDERYTIQRCFRCGLDGEVVFGFRIQRESYAFVENEGEFALSSSLFSVYITSKFFDVLGTADVRR